MVLVQELNIYLFTYLHRLNKFHKILRTKLKLYDFKVYGKRVTTISTYSTFVSHVF